MHPPQGLKQTGSSYIRTLSRTVRSLTLIVTILQLNYLVSQYLENANYLSKELIS